MPKSVRSFDRITIPAPCDADWDAMSGNDQVRFCEHCSLHVTNLSSMTRAEAMRFVAQSQGRICIRYIERPDGGLLIQKMPEKLYRIGKRVSRVAAGAFTATLSLSSVAAQTQSVSRGQSRVTVEAVQSNEDDEIIADEFSASISGTIKASEGDVIAAATVVLVNRESGEERTTTSSSIGQYSFQLLPRGDYLLWIRKPTFRTAREVLNVTAGRAVQQDIELENRMLSILGGAMASIMVEPEPLLKAINQDDIENVRALVFASPKPDG